jgi:hypothetical protein
MQVISLTGQASPAFISAAGQPRDLDQQKIRTLIEQKKLSDKEAQFYHKID